MGGRRIGRRVRAGQPAARGRAGRRRWSRRRTCRPPGASRTRSTCGWNGFRSTPTWTRPTAPHGGRRCAPGCCRQLDALDRIDRDIAWAAKRQALQLVHAVPRSAGRELSYRAYRAREGQGLDDYATWCALFEAHGPDWHDWPAELQHPGPPRCGRSATTTPTPSISTAGCNGCWTSNSATQAAATRAGMALGVMHDLAVGVHPEGSDSWALQDVFAQGVTVGAPPDAFNQNGQDWAQPPWRPDRLAEQAYAPFRDMVSTVLRSAGGVRVDHIIGLFRLWWIPEGHGPTEGTYLRYDHEALVGILALEAKRARALVVGEDLGTVEPWVRDYLRERGILGTSILWFEFEFDGSGAPLRPEWWREYCLASVTTHDLPPTAGYLAGDHVRLRGSAGPADQVVGGGTRRRRRRTQRLAGGTPPAGALPSARGRGAGGAGPDAADAGDARCRRPCMRCTGTSPGRRRG